MANVSGWRVRARHAVPLLKIDDGCFCCEDGKETLLRDGTAHGHNDAIIAMHDKADSPSKV
jgi:hypothetical protein